MGDTPRHSRWYHSSHCSHITMGRSGLYCREGGSRELYRRWEDIDWVGGEIGGRLRCQCCESSAAQALDGKIGVIDSFHTMSDQIRSDGIRAGMKGRVQAR